MSNNSKMSNIDAWTGQPVSNAPVQQPSNVYNEKDRWIHLNSKSRGVAFVLTLLLGPVGLIYATPVWGIILSIIAVLTSPLGPLVIWIASILVAGPAVNNHNEKVEIQANLMFQRKP